MPYDPERIVNIGELEKRGKTVRFGIKEKDRSRHIYVIGQTGTGKSTLLEMLAMQDIRNGTGLIFMDPHGQSVEALLNYVTQDYLDNIIYFAPHHQERPIGLNIMEDIGYDKRHLVVSSLMASFEKIWGAGTWSDRMAYILQNTLLALIEYPGTTLLDVGRMYSSKGFREKVVANLKDPQVRKYWVEEFANYTERYAQEATPSIQNKLGQFTSNPLMRNIIGQKESAFNFREIMDEGKILLVNLSKGQIGENNARMLGVLFTTKIYLAALSRSDLTKAELEAANPCNFFVDEFQSFANSSFSDILSEARKYKLNLVMAHQYLGQLYSDDAGGGDVIRDAVFGNVGTFVSFRVGPVDAEIISKQFAPDIMEEDLVALPRYHIYLTLNIDGAGSTPFSARTFYEPAPEGMSLEEEVVRRTMDTYGVDRAIVEKMVEDNLAEDEEMNAAAKKGGGKQGGGKKFGGQQGGGQRGGGQKGGGRQGAPGGDSDGGETHTPLKGLVQQMMQGDGQRGAEKSKEREPKAERSKGERSRSATEKPQMENHKEEGLKAEKPREERPRREGRLKAERSNVKKPREERLKMEASKSDQSDKPKMDGPKEHKLREENIQIERKPESEKLKSETLKMERSREERSGGQKHTDQIGRKREHGKGVKQEVPAPRIEKPKSEKPKERFEQRDVAVSEREIARAVDTSETQNPSSGGGRKRRGRGSGDGVSGRGQRGQRRSGSEDATPSEKGSGRRRRRESQNSRGGGGRQGRDAVEKPAVRREMRRDAAPKREEKEVVADAGQRDVGRVQRQEKKKQSQMVDALRRPSGVAIGTVSRSAAQQPVVEQGVTHSDALSSQQDTQDAAPKQAEKQPISAGGLGDLVKTTKASGLRKDLKVAPKKERVAPPVSYEEGWVAIGDLTPK